LHLSKKVPFSPFQEEAMAGPEFPAGFVPFRSVKRKIKIITKTQEGTW
jgi:hypothetical protein